MSQTYYIDLGTENTLIYQKDRGFVLNEPSIIAFHKKKHLLGSGKMAKQMLGKNPPQISLNKPLKEGVIADFDGTIKMLQSFFSEIQQTKSWTRPTMVISLPYEVTKYEREAVREVGLSLGAGKVILIDEPLAAAIGEDIPVTSAQGSLVVDIGGGTTEMAVISCGGIINAQAVRIGGRDMDQAIINYLRFKHNLLIGEQTAEYLKKSIGSALPSEKVVFCAAGGIDLTLGLPKIFKVNSQDIFEAIDPILNSILLALHATLENCPPETSGDIIESGITLVGGGALLKNMNQRIQNATGIRVKVGSDPLLSVAKGGARTADHLLLLDKIEHR